VYAIDVRKPLTYKNHPAASSERAAHPGPPTYAMKSEIVCFNLMLANVRQVSARARSRRRPTRPDEIDALTIKRLRAWTQLSQPEFARLLGVELSTLRNWEQGRREPTGPARALLWAICSDLEPVLRALGSTGKRRGLTLRRREAAA